MDRRVDHVVTTYVAIGKIGFGIFLILSLWQLYNSHKLQCICGTILPYTTQLDLVHCKWWLTLENCPPSADILCGRPLDLWHSSRIERMKALCVWLCIQAAISCCNNSFFCYPRMETLYAPIWVMLNGVRQGGQGVGLSENSQNFSFRKIFDQKCKTGWKYPILGHLWSKLKFWAPIIFSVSNLQLSVRKLQLHVLF